MEKFRVRHEMVFDIEAENIEDTKAKICKIFNNIKDIDILYTEGKVIPVNGDKDI